jgi:hypothetical protein
MIGGTGGRAGHLEHTAVIVFPRVWLLSSGEPGPYGTLFRHEYVLLPLSSWRSCPSVCDSEKGLGVVPYGEAHNPVNPLRPVLLPLLGC